MSSRNKKKNHQTPDTGYEKCIRMDQDAKASSKMVSVECNTFLAEYEEMRKKVKNQNSCTALLYITIKLLSY